MNSTSALEEIQKVDQKRKLSAAGVATVVGAGGAVLALAFPAKAEDSQLTTMVTGITTIAGSAITLLVLVMGARLAVKQINRILTKG